MCGRIIQKSDPSDYLDVSGWSQAPMPFEPGAWRPGYNIPPGTRPFVLHRLDAEPALARMHWGYRPHWYKRSPAINARLDTVLKGSPFWRPLLARRAVVPADGWYEWTGEPGRRQPWLIRARDERPILFAALTAWCEGAEGPEHGMAIVTDDAAGGMLDVHDRRPVALTSEDARAWADPEAPWDDARNILTTPRPEDAFFWYPVTTRVNSSRFDNAEALEPIELPDPHEKP